MRPSGRRTFIREKRIYCGKKYLEVDIYPITIEEHRQRRKEKQQPSPMKLLNQNAKQARRYFVQLVHSNFDTCDYHVSATYAKLPETVEDAERIARNLIVRIKRRMKRKGLGPLKYIIITESGTSKKTGKIVRLHHHIIISGQLSRDEIEDLWRERKKKGEAEGKVIGWINVDRLKPNEYGLEALCRYLVKNPNGKRRWSPSQNLTKPNIKTNDSKYSRRKVEEMAKADEREYWEAAYPGYILTECKPEYTDERGWAIYLKLRKLVI